MSGSISTTVSYTHLDVYKRQPLFCANEVDFEVAWFSPQSEYRPTEYLQHWVRFWFDDALRLEAAKAIQRARLSRIVPHWCDTVSYTHLDVYKRKDHLG